MVLRGLRHGVTAPAEARSDAHAMSVYLLPPHRYA